MESEPGMGLRGRGADKPVGVRCNACGGQATVLAPGERLSKAGGEVREVTAACCGVVIRLRVEVVDAR